MASRLVYLLTPLPTCQVAIEETNNLLFSFLWDGKGDKIKRNIIINDYQEGGARMLDLKAFNFALKKTWITKYLDDDNKGKWKNLFNLSLQRLGGKKAFVNNLNKRDLRLETIKDTFLQELLAIWAEINFQDKITLARRFLRPNFMEQFLNTYRK